MKLTCPACNARYTVATERLDGRKVKVRCRRCGESFPVDSSQQSGEVYARQSENRRARDADLFAGAATAGAEGSEEASSTSRASAPGQATPLTGERNESSVLFSLAALAKQAPAPPAPSVTESSALIDIRALISATSKGDAPAPRADDIANLSGGGAFASLFTAPLAPPVTWPDGGAAYVPAESEAGTRGRKGPILIGAMALAVVAMVGAVAFAGVRSRSGASAGTAAATAAATAASAPAYGPSVAGAAPSSPVATAASEPPPASGTPLAAGTPERTTANAPPARSAARAGDA
ncbi:MAG TPA: zinc-ribbon domain-containing protein, partial [Labilithrix sp.]|nr:zinc-ribbon domain-containing protein [Labilithrix sp.]